MTLNRKLLASLVVTLAVGLLIGHAVKLTDQLNASASSGESTASETQQDLEPTAVSPTITFASQSVSDYDTARKCTASSSVVFPSNGLGPFMKDPAFDMAAFAKRAADDPQKALEEGITLWENGEGGKAYYVALCFWLHGDPTAAFQYTHSIDNERIRTDAQVQILSRKFQSDPESVALAIRSLPGDSRFTRIARSTYESWSKQDIEAAASSALGLSDRDGRLPILLQMTRQWLAEDFQSATGFIASIDDRQLRQQLARQNAQAIIRSDPQLAMAIAHDADANEELLASTHYVRSVVHKDPDVVFDSIQSRYNAAEQRLLMDVFLTALTGKDAALAAKYVDRLPGIHRDNYYELVARSWARRDPETTINWLENAASPGSRAALANIGPVIAHHDVSTAMKLTPGIPTDLQFRWINSITEKLAEDDPADAYQWLRSFAKHERYASVVDLQVSRILATNVDAGVDLILQIPFIDRRSKLASIYVRYVAARNPAAAALLLSAAATETTERQMTNDLMREWARIDPANAKSWISNLPRSRSRDTAIMSFVKFSTDPPESMVLLCSGIENEHKRKLQIANLISTAQVEGIEDILGYMDSTSLPDDEKLWYQAHAREVKSLRPAK